MDRVTRLCVLAAAAVSGAHPRARTAAAEALAAGETDVRVRGVLRMLHPFAGFPRALDAWTTVAPVLAGAGAPAPEPADAASAGRAVFDAVYGPEAGAILGRIAALDAEAARRVIADAYGRVLSQGDLDLATRERIAVVMLAAQGLVNQIRGHVRGALRTGASEADLLADLAACEEFVGADAAAGVRAAVARGA